mgnify:CR=1 FL=1
MAVWNFFGGGKPYDNVAADLTSLDTSVLRQIQIPELAGSFQGLDVIVERNSHAYSLNHQSHAMFGPQLEFTGPKEVKADYDVILAALVKALGAEGKKYRTEEITLQGKTKLKTNIPFGSPRDSKASYTLQTIADYLELYRGLGQVTTALLRLSNVPKKLYDRAVKAGLPLQEVKS